MEAAASLVASLRSQPLIVVLRLSPDSGDGLHVFERARAELLRHLTLLAEAGLRHVELAWSPHPQWPELVRQARRLCPDVLLGAASITDRRGLEAASACGLRFAISPVLCADLLERATALGLLLVPGVFSPSEVHRAVALGCAVVKLFPASSLGPRYWSQLAAPLGSLPFCIASGGLTPADVIPWLDAGVDAVALGRRWKESGPQASGDLRGLLDALEARSG
ncbi:bifunctional 4-hydroxy-2-oxoglutarate aldolase/2-dehydro-3-deoxy-phosphogluconate aldolase [Synechococcus sp. RSCCF101]|uniref:bifunctional 4-hydroxy-2-oxoglutarate aldolase/2-dehydro-3-deoxy-phosphogluconate aldolase n=1 Tax=Synechococcus sp. RSCCF101 TaxID=2511069 RepID=UPI0012475AB5|nr:bifunctional 4-hydroxy-2-oxoglutarate aldolase/2-dehydro-3-deoxy-phosphogluconate aldolase [Synechococcus sp. RSCCF101]QEY32236.1 bifunctional 4-hydroxy-2-oxoglutarate aldolase/2-dehydro-3-deoxy-phosphogluconate aldolase [Synechococcus sp. RSCCF101]